MLLEGNFTSLYKNRVSKSQLDRLDSTGIPFKGLSEENKMIVVADGDVVLNNFIQEFDSSGEVNRNIPPRPIEMGWNKYTYTEYLLQQELGKYFVPVANKDFFLKHFSQELIIN